MIPTSYNKDNLLNTSLDKLIVSISTFTIIYAFFNFGSFGFFNLFGARRISQFIVLLFLSFTLFFIFKERYKKKTLLIVLFFFSYYYINFLISTSNYLVGFTNIVLSITIFLFLIKIEIEYIKIIAKLIFLISFIFTTMVLLAYILFFIEPNLINQVDFEIYTSLITSEQIYPKHWVEYLSFTSGDGFMLFDLVSTRMKGFSNEPSSSIVHYFSPIALSLLLSKKYRTLGFISIFINLIAISSALTWIIIFLSLLLTLFFKVFCLRNAKRIIYILIFIGIFILVNFDLAYSIFMKIGTLIDSNLSMDLFARKIGSLDTRLTSIIDSLVILFNYPFGGNYVGLPIGLVFNVLLVGGIILFPIVVFVFFKMINLCLKKYYYLELRNRRFGISIVLSTIIVLMFISGYGWDNSSGLIMLLLYYRLITDLKVKNIRN